MLNVYLHNIIQNKNIKCDIYIRIVFNKLVIHYYIKYKINLMHITPFSSILLSSMDNILKIIFNPIFIKPMPKVNFYV